MSKEINIANIAKEAPIEIYPQLFNIVAVENGTQKVLLYTGTHYTKEEAEEQFKIKIVLKTGIPADLWIIKVITSISAEDLEKDFKQIKEKTEEERRMTKNKLMKQIIDNKDINLLHRHHNRFNTHEVLYIHDAIK